MTIPRPPIAVLPDTADTRLLVDLTTHANDLSEASHTLACALSAGEESELWMPLTSHAVTAYIRPFIFSNVRRRLDEMPGIILERLRTWLKDQAPETIDGWELPEVIHAIDSEFTAAHRRRRIARFPSYWRIEQPGEELPYEHFFG